MLYRSRLSYSHVGIWRILTEVYNTQNYCKHRSTIGRGEYHVILIIANSQHAVKGSRRLIFPENLLLLHKILFLIFSSYHDPEICNLNASLNRVSKTVFRYYWTSDGFHVIITIPWESWFVFNLGAEFFVPWGRYLGLHWPFVEPMATICMYQTAEKVISSMQEGIRLGHNTTSRLSKQVLVKSLTGSATKAYKACLPVFLDDGGTLL
jgi:hypothetical protein